MLEKTIQIIEKTIYATVATSTLSGEPWDSPVYIVYDGKLNFYWASGKASQHSRNIDENPHVFLTIYDSSVPWGTGEGAFIQADAIEITDPDEIAKACQLRKYRVPDAKQPPEDFMGDRPRRIYRATPKKIWMNQDGRVDGYFVDTRIEMDLDKLRVIA
jgi:nitroimidazol reductase NimA-like FMN-containing flavoprotein (pyridoxamine 5'-phosphate oxidase superfamily)